jgi:hypothetical protein
MRQQLQRRNSLSSSQRAFSHFETLDWLCSDADSQKNEPPHDCSILGVEVQKRFMGPTRCTQQIHQFHVAYRSRGAKF